MATISLGKAIIKDTLRRRHEVTFEAEDNGDFLTILFDYTQDQLYDDKFFIDNVTQHFKALGYKGYFMRAELGIQGKQTVFLEANNKYQWQEFLAQYSSSKSSSKKCSCSIQVLMSSGCKCGGV